MREVVQGAGDGPLAERQTGGEGGRPLRGAVEEVDAGGAGRREGQGGRLAGDAGPEDGHLLPPQRAQLHRRDVDGDGGDGGVAVEPAQLAHPPARFQGVLEGEVQLRAQGALGGAGQEGLPHLADDLALAQGQAVQAGGHPDQVLDGVHPAAGKDVGAQVSQRHPGLRRQEALQAGGRSRGALRGPGVDLQAVAGDQGHRRPHGLPYRTAEGGLPLPGAGGGEGLPHGHVGRVVGDAGQHQRSPPSAGGRSGGHRPPPAGAASATGAAGTRDSLPGGRRGRRRASGRWCPGPGRPPSSQPVPRRPLWWGRCRPRGRRVAAEAPESSDAVERARRRLSTAEGLKKRTARNSPRQEAGGGLGGSNRIRDGLVEGEVVDGRPRRAQGGGQDVAPGRGAGEEHPRPPPPRWGRMAPAARAAV